MYKYYIVYKMRGLSGQKYHFSVLSCRATTTQPPNLMNWNMTGMIQTLTASGGLSYTAGN